MSEENEKTAFGWSETVDTTNVSNGEHVLLSEGEALFTVLKVTRARKPFGSFGTIDVAVVSLLCRSGEAEAKTEVHLGLDKALLWKICHLFESVGLREKGSTGPWAIPWDKLPNTMGRCVIKHRKFARRDDKPGEKTGVAFDVDKFLPFEFAGEASVSESQPADSACPLNF